MNSVVIRYGDADPYTDFVREQRASILMEFSDQMFSCLMATTFEHLMNFSELNGWGIGTIFGADGKKALVLKKKDSRGKALPPELWVAVKYTQYRRAFALFLAQEFEIGTPQIPQKWQVDHLLGKSRFRTGSNDYFVRLVLLDRSSNASFGAGFEKIFYSRERFNPPSGGFHLDWVTLLKVRGNRLPSIRVGPIGWAEWAWDIAGEFESTGIEDRVTAYAGITLVLNLGYMDKYAPLPVPPQFLEAAKAYTSYDCFGLGR